MLKWWLGLCGHHTKDLNVHHGIIDTVQNIAHVIYVNRHHNKTDGSDNK